MLEKSAFHHDLEVKQLKNGKITKKQFKNRMVARGAAARKASKYMPQGRLIIAAVSITEIIVDIETSDVEKDGAGKNDKHRDGGRAADKNKEQLEALEAQAATATGNDKKKLKAKIKKIKRMNNKKKDGTAHHRCKQKGKK